MEFKMFRTLVIVNSKKHVFSDMFKMSANSKLAQGRTAWQDIPKYASIFLRTSANSKKSVVLTTSMLKTSNSKHGVNVHIGIVQKKQEEDYQLIRF